MNGRKFHIAFCTDDTFAQYTSVAICSLISNASDPDRIHLWILDAGLSRKSRQLIKLIAEKCKAQIDFLLVDVIEDQTLAADRHISRATYGRLLLPEILDKSIKTCLYIDGDVIVVDDIIKLSAFSCNNYPIAAVDDFYLTGNPTLSIPNYFKYFNAGVLLVNLENWRTDNIADQILHFVRDYPEKLTYWDQDAMNAVLYNKRMPLPLRWNQQIHFDDCLSHLPDGSKTSEMKEAMSDPAIVHFVGPEKPWHYLCLHPYKDLYLKYREKTPWGAIELPKPEQLPSFFAEKRVIVFGAGKTGKVTIRQYRQYGCNPEYLLDNDPLKIGDIFEDLPVLSPSHLLNENPDSMVIVIASMYRDEIKAQLQGMGLQEFRHFVVRGSEPQLKTE
jgi:lipopolysaccharide biosynthesis glycosyltransferase